MNTAERYKELIEEARNECRAYVRCPTMLLNEVINTSLSDGTLFSVNLTTNTADFVDGSVLWVDINTTVFTQSARC